MRYITLTARVALRSITFIDSQISSDAIVVSEPELIVPSDPDSVLNNVHHRASVTTVSHSNESDSEVHHIQNSRHIFRFLSVVVAIAGFISLFIFSLHTYTNAHSVHLGTCGALSPFMIQIYIRRISRISVLCPPTIV